MNGSVIWNKMQGTFVPISSIPVYATMQHERFRQSREQESHNFQLQNLTLTSFQEKNFLEFYDNDTKVTGLCGDLWTLLSQSLNFTLQPVRSNESSLGVQENKTYQHGLLGIIFRNETTVIPKVETYSMRLLAVDFSIPLWMNSQRLYIHQEGIHDSTWMAKVFSWQIWCMIVAIHVLLSVCSFCSQTVVARRGDKCKSTTFGDHFFYNFGMLCKQSYIPDILEKRSRILEISLGLFCSVLHMAFGAVLFIYMTKSIFIAPFDSLDSMVAHSKYSVVSVKGSIADIAFKRGTQETFTRVRVAKRNIAASTVEEMFEMACSKGKHYALMQGEDEFKMRENTICHLTLVGKPYLQMWIAAGIAKNFKYKRTIDLGILKLMEVGLLDALIERRLSFKNDIKINKTEAIRMDQVSLVIEMMCCGIIIAFIILVIEKIVYAYKLKQS